MAILYECIVKRVKNACSDPFTLIQIVIWSIKTCQMLSADFSSFVYNVASLAEDTMCVNWSSDGIN